MSLFRRNLPIGVAVLAATLGAAAQAPQPAPAPASAQTPAYGSAFDGYRPFEAREVQDWRKSNDTVREIGGWRAYAREIQEGNKAGSAPQSQTQPSSAPAAAGSAPKAPDPHAGHAK